MDIITPLRRCSKCGDEFPETLEYFARHKTSKNGLLAKCRACQKQDNHEHYMKPEVRQRRSQWSREYYHRPGIRERKLEYEKERYSNPEIRERHLQRHREYAQRPDVKSRIDAHNAEYFSRPDIKAQRNQYMKVYGYGYRERPHVRQARKIRGENRRVHEREGRITVQDVELQLRSQKNRCWHCGKKIKGNRYHIDHLIPLSRGGNNEPRNIVISCPHCNLSKGAKPCYEWNGRLF